MNLTHLTSAVLPCGVSAGSYREQQSNARVPQRPCQALRLGEGPIRMGEAPIRMGEGPIRMGVRQWEAEGVGGPRVWRSIRCNLELRG